MRFLPLALLLTLARPLAAQTPAPPSPTPLPPATPRVEALKQDAAEAVDGMATLTQQMVDSIFSFAELGFQERQTSRYVTDVLRKHGFAVQEGVAGIPTSWVASWGSGSPVIALGSDIDGIPRASQKPGVAYRSPIVEGAPGHGEGHNSGVPLNITAAIAVKQLMQREKLAGTIRLWPGVAEEQLASKAWLVRAGVFDGVDVVIFTHVDRAFATSWGPPQGTGLVSVQYTFTGETAHSAGAPWRGRSALDAVELMNIGWNYRREHLRLQHRSHYVVVDGGDQPNVVPRTATVWYYFRETEYPRIKALWEIGDTMAAGAASMTGTTWTSKVVGAAWPQHFNKVIAEVLDANIRKVGLPAWTDADQTLARAVQKELGVADKGLAHVIEPLKGPVRDEDNRGGGSDDIGDVSWVVPTVSLRYPANIPDLPGHNWADAIAMATPIAHKGTTAGAKALAMTLVDLLMRPAVVDAAWAYFRDVQTKTVKYESFISNRDDPPTWLNRSAMETWSPELEKLYYDPARYKTYMEQLGITYPTLK